MAALDANFRIGVDQELKPQAAQRARGERIQIPSVFFVPSVVETYASIRNWPPRMIWSWSTQMSKLRPTTSMCVDENHSAPVCAP